MSEWDRFDEPADRLHSFASGFHATFHVYTGVECGLFRALVEPKTAETLAETLSLHGPYVRRFCEAGLRWGLLDVAPADGPGGTDAPRFRLREEFVPYLAEPEGPQYMGELFRFLGQHLSADYTGYPAAFDAGGQRPVAERGDRFSEVIEGTTRGLQEIFVDGLLPDLEAFEATLSHGGRLLDVGCGSGYLAARLCQRFPDVEVVGIDLDADAIERARDRAAERGVADRTTFQVQDAREVAERVDAAVLFLSLHEITSAARAEMFDSFRETISEDGVIAVFDDVYPADYEEFDRQPFAAGVETQWSELTWETDVPTRREQRSLLSLAGFEERFRTTLVDRFDVFEGVKR